ncbi:head GIN domain-containing protein [Chloroflexota bacterium]
MKKAIVAVLLGVLLISGLLAGCIREGVPGSGNLVTQEFEFSDFTRVEVGSAFEVEIVQADSFRVSVTADDNLFEHIQVSKQGETLKIGLKLVPLRPLFSTLKAEITMPQIRGLDLSGATRGTVSGFSSTENLDTEVSGASSLDMTDMSAGDVEFELSGASRARGDITAGGDARFNLSGASSVQLQGSASDLVIAASGASRVELDNFPVASADVKLSGASGATVNLDGRLDANLSGASRLSYIGEPTMGDIDTSGGSSVSKK